MVDTCFHTQFCEISERVHDFFEHIFYEIVVAKATPIYKRQLLYKRRKRKGVCIPGIDSLEELLD